MNVVLLTGNLARDPEKTYTTSGMAVTRFTIAVNRNYSKKTEGGQDADFIRITCFDKRAEFVEKYLTKGRKVGVEARVQTGSYQGKDGNTVYTTDFIANNIEFLDSKRDAGGGGGFSDGGGGFGGQFAAPPDAGGPEAGMPDAPPPAPTGFAEIDDDDDMPF
ncbi:MAG: single-stranded DNA-binding protein [Clostridiales bacterium]|nr:single-stranded DNA-binding protein [Clostridiales bacterium]